MTDNDENLILWSCIGHWNVSDSCMGSSAPWEAPGKPLGSPSVLGGCAGTLGGGPVFCRRLPIACLLIPLKNWSRSLIGAWRGSSGSGVRVWFTQQTPSPPNYNPLTLLHPSHLLFLLSHWPTFWWSGKISPLASDIYFIHLGPKWIQTAAGFFSLTLLFGKHWIWFTFLFLFSQHFLYWLHIIYRCTEKMLHKLIITHVKNYFLCLKLNFCLK